MRGNPFAFWAINFAPVAPEIDTPGTRNQVHSFQSWNPIIQVGNVHWNRKVILVKEPTQGSTIPNIHKMKISREANIFHLFCNSTLSTEF